MQRITIVAHPGARSERVELLDDTSLAVWVRVSLRERLLAHAVRSR